MSMNLKPEHIIGTVVILGVTYWIVKPSSDLLDEPVIPPGSNGRQAVVAAAASQVGLSDKSPYCKVACRSPDQYNWPKYWCAVFVMWAFIVAKLPGATWKVGDPNWFLSYHLKPTTDPQPGDVAYFTTNQHHAIVEKIDQDGTIRLINGDGSGGKVTRSTTTKAAVTVFYSIERLL